MSESTLIPRSEATGKPTIHFDSWDELLDFIEKPLDEECARVSRSIHSQTIREEFHRSQGSFDKWAGGISFDTMKELMRDGFWDVEEEIAKAAAPIIGRITSLVERPDPYHELVGHEIDIARYCEGEPECWLDVRRPIIDSTGNRIVRIGINCIFSAGFDNDSILARGVVICALIECLEMAGIRCEVTCTFGFTPRSGTFRKAFERKAYEGDCATDIRLVLKSADQPLDLGRLCFAVCHPAFLRVLGFDLGDHLDEETQRALGGSRGPALENPTSLKDEFDIWFGGMSLFNEVWHNKKKLEKFLLQNLANQGIEVDYDFSKEDWEQHGTWDRGGSNAEFEQEDDGTRNARERMYALEQQRKTAERIRLEEEYKRIREARRGKVISRRRMKKIEDVV